MKDRGTLFTVPKTVTLATSSTSGATDASNMLHDEKALVWRSTGLTGQYISIVQSGSWDVIALIGTNLRAQDTIRVRAANSLADVTANPAINQTFAAFSGTPKATGAMVLFRLSSPVTHSHVRIDITSTGNPDGFIQVSNLVLGKGIEWDGVDAGAEVTYDNQTTTYMRKYLTKPSWKINLSGIPQSAYYDEWEDFLLKAGERGGFLYVPIYNDAYTQKRSAYVSISNPSKTTMNTFNDFTIELTVATIQ